MVQILLDRGADVNVRDWSGFTAFYWASCNGHAEVVQILLDRGADVHVRGSIG